MSFITCSRRERVMRAGQLALPITCCSTWENKCSRVLNLTSASIELALGVGLQVNCPLPKGVCPGEPALSLVCWVEACKRKTRPPPLLRPWPHFYGKWESLSQGHESRRTDHFSHQLQHSGR